MKTETLPLHPQAKILFENDVCFVVDKPAGVLSHPNSGAETRSSILDAKYNLKDEYFTVGKTRVFLIHRLDKETSGCLLLAKDEATASNLQEQFAQSKISKTYLALVAGVLREPTHWKDHLSKTGGKMRYVPRQKPNVETEAEPSEIFPTSKMTLLRLRPMTGKTHQLRVQGAKRNFHILGDRIHGNFPKNAVARKTLGLKRMFLHAEGLSFTVPGETDPVRVQSGLPQELQNVLLTLMRLESGKTS